jgi:purine nucleoside phosphorylase
MDKPKIGFVGGTGFDHIDGFSMEGMESVYTPFNGLINSRTFRMEDLEGITGEAGVEYVKKHSPDVVVQEYDKATGVFLARHGAGHKNSACDTNYLANMYALFVSQKVDYAIGFTAVGSLSSNLPVGSLVLFDGIYRHDHEASFTLNPYMGRDVIHLGTQGQECSSVVRELVKRELIEVQNTFRDLNTLESPKVWYDGNLALINRDDTFSTPAESRDLRSLNKGNNVCVGMTGYELISAMMLGGQMALVGLVVDMDNTIPGKEVDQAYINENVARFKPIVAGITEGILGRGQKVDPNIGLLPLKRSILSPATPTNELRRDLPELADLVGRAKDLDPESVQYPEWYRG